MQDETAGLAELERGGIQIFEGTQPRLLGGF
jgi:hypothetical protein